MNKLGFYIEKTTDPLLRNALKTGTPPCGGHPRPGSGIVT